MKAKTKKMWQRVAVWLIIIGFVLGSVAVYAVGFLGAPEGVSTPPPLQSLPEAQQNQPAAAGGTTTTTQPAP